MATLIVAVALALVPARVITLADALALAVQRQPSMRQAHATTAVFRARADEARAPLLPQLNATATYQRATSNFAPRPGTLPRNVMTAPPVSSFDTSNYFAFGITASQLLWDFGQTLGRWRAAEALASSQADSERATRLQLEATVRAAYYGARAQKSLVQVAQETLANQERHLQQIQAFVTVGTRPSIDLAQAKTDRANAAVQLINAENNAETARLQLANAIGVEGGDFDVADEAPVALAGEEDPLETQLAEALKARPEVVALEGQVRAQALTLRAVKGAYGPTLSGTMGLTDAGVDIDKLAWNWSATFNLNWPLFSGLLTVSQVREGEAQLVALDAQRASLRLQVRLEVEQARLAVRAARAALSASDEALESARERLHLAEGRYQAGVGNVIELGDAQLALTQAAAQRVTAEYNLATARSGLERALGRP